MSLASSLYPDDSPERLGAVESLGLLDTDPEDRFDRLCLLASQILDAPATYISLLDGRRQWFKSTHGMGDVRETPREGTFCDYAIRRSRPTVILDAAQDPFFASSPYVTDGPRVQFYAGFPLTVNGQRVGTICALDFEPRSSVPPECLEQFYQLARVVEVELTRPSGNATPGQVSTLALCLRWDFERYLPEEVSTLLELYFELVAEVLGRWGGVLEYANPDVMRALFSHEGGHALMAAGCALDLRATLQDFDEALRQRDLQPAEHGIAVHTGEAEVQSTGTSDGLRFTIAGPLRQVRDRLERGVEAGQLLITSETREALGDLAHADGSFALADGQIRVFHLHSVKGVGEL